MSLHYLTINLFISIFVLNEHCKHSVQCVSSNVAQFPSGTNIRAAMGRARFLLCTGFVNGAAMGRVRFMFYPLFIFFFVVLSVTRRRPRPTLNHAICNVYSQKVVET